MWKSTWFEVCVDRLAKLGSTKIAGRYRMGRAAKTKAIGLSDVDGCEGRNFFTLRRSYPTSFLQMFFDLCTPLKILARGARWTQEGSPATRG